MKRINQSSSIWQQFGFIGDLLTIDESQKVAKYHETVSVDYIHEAEQWKDQHQFILTLEFGQKASENDTVLGMKRQRQDEIDKAKDAALLHPVIRHYHNGQPLSEHHVIEVLEARWNSEVLHVEPLFKYLTQELATIVEHQFVGNAI